MKFKNNDIARAITVIHPLEVVCALAIILAINRSFYPEDPGFLGSRYNPLLFITIFFSIFYNKKNGIITLFLAIASAVLFPLFIHGPVHPFIISEQIRRNLSSDTFISGLMQLGFMGLISIFIFGEIRDNLGRIIKNLKLQKDRLIKNIEKLKFEIKALSLVNEEYQDRILGQENSLISLYSTMVALNSLNLDHIYPNVVEAVSKFTGAIKCSLWRYDRETHELESMASHGWEQVEHIHRHRLPDAESIIGWVARNNAMFSVKMLHKHQKLRDLDKGNCIITVPINIENKVWGVINIEEMPFIKYNLYSEQLTMMIADLVSPAIGNALRFFEITRKGEVNPITGFNSIDELFRILKDEFHRAITNNINLSFILIELSNYEEMKEQLTNDEILLLIKEISKPIIQISKGNAMIFQYKDISQFALVIPNMDYDGAAMFCLNIIEKIGTGKFSINDKLMQPHILLGYSNLRTNHRSEEDLIELAENLLLMQKI